MATLDYKVIFFEILPKLPTKSLIRFKCVSKYFNSAISSAVLMDLHFRHHHLSSSDQHLLILPDKRSINCYNLHHPLSFSTPTSTFTWSDSSVISVVGSSNGLLCVFVQTTDIHNSDIHMCVLNPTTRLHRDIHVSYDDVRFNLGFGFDPQTLDHKLVIVHADYKTLIARVFSLNTNSWNIIQTQFPDTLILERCNSGVLVDHNLLHWIVWNPSLIKRDIVCFNLSTNKWTNPVLLPEFYYNTIHKNDILYDIGVIDGRLFSSFENKVEDRLEVWVMKEYGVQGSWFRLLSMPIPRGFHGSQVKLLNIFIRRSWHAGTVPVYSREGSDEVLIQQRQREKLQWYNTRDGRLTDAVFNGAPNSCDAQVYTCCTSLVQPSGGELFDES
ncbi:hypothetical protein RND81_06G208800 [Saponaria officinalis]|uniref:F-box domain-containing protein n=1 Tax=Saponaria officinalis TaxID=3572 RepID=A0AAW1KC66_SAPOF